MVSKKLLSIHPQNLQFPFKLKKHIFCTVQLINNTDNYVAFQVKTTTPKNYFVQPNVGIVMPHTTFDISVIMLAKRKAPADMQCKDKFLIQSVITTRKTAINCGKHITSIYDMFKKGCGNIVEQKLEVSYISPPREGSNKGDLLTIHPQELQFPWFKHASLVDWENRNSCFLKLTNNINSYVAFKVKTTTPKKYCVSPSHGIVLPYSTHDVEVWKLEAATNMECSDKFLIQSVIASPSTTREDIYNDMFKKASGNIVEQKVKVSYISPPQPLSIPQEGSNKGSYVSPPQPLSIPQEISNKGDMLSIHPPELLFPFELNELISCNMQLTNNTDCYVAFKFNKVSGNFVDECILKASYVSPPQPPSATQESSDGVTVPDFAKSRPDSIKSLGILQNSNFSPPPPASAAQESSDECDAVLDDGNLRLDPIKYPGELLSIQPQELQIRFKLNKEMFCTMKLTNNTGSYVAFKVKTTSTKKYYIRPYVGILMPHSTRYLLVMIQAQEEEPINLESKDTFLLSSITSPEATEEDIISDMFNGESANVVNEQKLKVRYVSPSQTLSAALQRVDLVKAPRSDDAEPEDNSSKKLVKHKKFFHSSGNLVENTMLLFKLWIFGVLVGYLVLNNIV